MATRLSQYNSVVPAQIERRAEPRRRVYLSRVTLKNRGRVREARLHDLSIYGCRVACDALHKSGERVRVQLFGRESAEAIVVWCTDGFLGCRFDAPIARETVRALTLGVG